MSTKSFPDKTKQNILNSEQFQKKAFISFASQVQKTEANHTQFLQILADSEYQSFSFNKTQPPLKKTRRANYSTPNSSMDVVFKPKAGLSRPTSSLDHRWTRAKKKENLWKTWNKINYVQDGPRKKTSSKRKLKNLSLEPVHNITDQRVRSSFGPKTQRNGKESLNAYKLRPFIKGGGHARKSKPKNTEKKYGFKLAGKHTSSKKSGDLSDSKTQKISSDSLEGVTDSPSFLRTIKSKFSQRKKSKSPVDQNLIVFSKTEESRDKGHDSKMVASGVKGINTGSLSKKKEGRSRDLKSLLSCKKILKKHKKGLFDYVRGRRYKRF